jgi:hypothetical protein
LIQEKNKFLNEENISNFIFIISNKFLEYSKNFNFFESYDENYLLIFYKIFINLFQKLGKKNLI